MIEYKETTDFRVVKRFYMNNKTSKCYKVYVVQRGCETVTNFILFKKRKMEWHDYFKSGNLFIEPLKRYTFRSAKKAKQCIGDIKKTYLFDEVV